MPLMKDKAAWIFMLLEHRRILLERVIAEFPEILNTHRGKVEFLRHRLTF
jgi:hypothetical protein